ncbi:MAG: hypothetical protein NPIRA01_02650 [Nitrospirales bacterium]|nr:MAG: hypothetical protein NPIRA01_02650 [Nitrospirales bacterium]
MTFDMPDIQIALDLLQCQAAPRNVENEEFPREQISLEFQFQCAIIAYDAPDLFTPHAYLTHDCPSQ